VTSAFADPWNRDASGVVPPLEHAGSRHRWPFVPSFDLSFEETTVERTSTAKVFRRPAVIAVTAVAIAAMLLVATGRSSGPAVIRLGSAGTAAPMAEAATDAEVTGLDMRAFPAEYRFVLADSARFPAGEELAWRLERPADLRAATSTLASRLGLAGQEITDPFGDGSLQVGAVDGSGPTLWVGPAGDWSFSDQSWMPEIRCADEPMLEEPDRPTSGEDLLAADPVVIDEPAVIDEPSPCEPVSPPANLPDEAEARRAAETFFADLELAVTPRITEVRADEWGAWVSATLPLGTMASDLTVSVGLGPDATVTSANGTLAQPVEVDRYPTIDAEAAVERLAAMHTWQGGIHDVDVDPDVAVESPAIDTVEPAPGTADLTDPAEPAPESAPESAPEPDTAFEELATPDDEVSILPVPEPVGEPEVLTATLVAAEPLAMLIVDQDGISWLLPGVRFTDDEGGTWQVLTVADQYLDEEAADEPASPEPGVPEPVDPDPGPGAAEPGSGPAEPTQGPAPAPDPGELDASATERMTERLLGLSEQEAIRLIEDQGLVARIVSRDGEHLAVTDDLRLDRVNLGIERGEVAHADVG
jgi:hypothetical protein